MKVHFVTMGFAPARLIWDGLEKFYATCSALPFDGNHYLVDQHYPLRREENLIGLEAIQKRFGVNLLDPGQDMGLHRGFNWACDQIKPKPGDILICYDPDSGPTTKGWDLALVKALFIGDYSAVGLMSPRTFRELLERGYAEKTAGGVRVWEPDRPTVISVAAYRWDFLQRAGGFKEPNAYYGGLEAELWLEMLKQGGRWAYLPDFSEEDGLRDCHDPEYHAYKMEHGHRQAFPGSFKEFLERGCPTTGPVPAQLP